MKKCLIPAFLYFSSLTASPTSVFWTDCTTSCQPEDSALINLTSFSKRGTYDVGLLVGLFSWKGITSEGGVDYVVGSKRPFYLNGKIAIDEEKLFTHSPSCSIGLFNVGTSRKTNQAVVDAVFGTTLPYELGTFSAGVYRGRHTLGKKRSGWMVGYQKTFGDRWQLSCDYASGKNAIGGGGVALTYFFTPKTSLQTGPIWFNDASFYGKWRWSFQLNMAI